MLTPEYLNNNLFHCVPENYIGSFVAAAIQINNEGIAKHAGLVINCNEGTFLCHFDGENILIEEPPPGWYFFKIFEFIDPRLSTAFLAQCKNIKATSNPLYGCWYEGSYYNEAGSYYSATIKQEYMTCVGFCINVVKGFLSEESEEEFFNYTDWTHSDLPEWYLNEFVSKLQIIHQNVDINSLKENLRRIKPAEFLASAYLSVLPISRAEINQFLEELLGVIASKVQ